MQSNIICSDVYIHANMLLVLISVLLKAFESIPTKANV